MVLDWFLMISSSGIPKTLRYGSSRVVAGDKVELDGGICGALAGLVGSKSLGAVEVSWCLELFIELVLLEFIV